MQLPTSVPPADEPAVDPVEVEAITDVTAADAEARCAVEATLAALYGDSDEVLDDGEDPTDIAAPAERRPLDRRARLLALPARSAR